MRTKQALDGNKNSNWNTINTSQSAPWLHRSEYHLQPCGSITRSGSSIPTELFLNHPGCRAAPAARKHNTLQTLNLNKETADPLPSSGIARSRVGNGAPALTFRRTWREEPQEGLADAVWEAQVFGSPSGAHRRGDVHRSRHAESFDLLPLETTIAET